MKYKFKLSDPSAEYRPNGYLGHLKMFVGDEQADQVGRYTESKDRLKVEFNFKVKDKIYQVIVESLTYWDNHPPRRIFEENSNTFWMSNTSDPENVWISVETDMPITRFEYLNRFDGGFHGPQYNNKLLLIEETTNTIIFDGNTPAYETISVDVPLKLNYHNKNTFISFK